MDFSAQSNSRSRKNDLSAWSALFGSLVVLLLVGLFAYYFCPRKVSPVPTQTVAPEDVVDVNDPGVREKLLRGLTAPSNKSVLTEKQQQELESKLTAPSESSTLTPEEREKLLKGLTAPSK